MDKRRKSRRRRPAAGGGAFELEMKAIDKGMLGGILLMVIAAVWFFLGLAGGYIFFYPPILFIFGLYGFFKGLFKVLKRAGGESARRPRSTREPRSARRPGSTREPRSAGRPEGARKPKRAYHWDDE